MKKFNWRGIFKDITSEEVLKGIIAREDSKKVSFYVGIDPTGPELHLGHLLPFISVKLIQEEFNFKPIFIIGGFTGSIGDPSGKTSERVLLRENIIEENVINIEKRINYLCDKLNIKDYLIINNKTFYEGISIIDFYRDFGKHFNVNRMLAKDMVKKRLETTGISYTEFSYQLFQAIDFFFLNKKHNCKLQIGGSDQWGNILSGIELIGKTNSINNNVFGITTNLLVDESGKKIGKSEGQPLWVNEDLVPSYRFYQYFFNLSDVLAEDLLKKLTLIKEEEYLKIKILHQEAPHQRFFQKELAKRFLDTFYNVNSYQNAVDISQWLFKREYEKLSLDDYKMLETQLPFFTIALDDEETIVEKLISLKIISSKREASEFINQKAMKINNEVIEEINFSKQNLKKLINNESSYFIVDYGKKKKYLFKLEN